jgi:PAS domain S-box-containing protein
MLQAKTKSLSQILLANMLLVATLSCVLVGCLWVIQEAFRFNTGIVAMRDSMITSRKQRMKEQVGAAIAYLQFMRRQTESRTQSIIRERVTEAYLIATHIHEQYKDTRSSAELEAMVRETLRPIRFNNGRGYFFATRLDGVEQLCATCTNLENTDLTNLQDTRGAYVIRDMIEVVRKDGEGYYSYTWGKPDAPGKAYAKISFVKLFEPFQWFFGTGEYLGDVEEDLQQEALQWIQNIRYEKDGYIFAGRWDGTSLSGPAIGRNMYEVTDLNGVKIVQEMINASRNGGGFVEYVMPKLEGQRPEPKISYAEGVPEWQWYIGTGLYIDDIERDIAEYRRRSMTNLLYNIGKILVTMLFLWLAVFMLVTRISRKTRRMLTTFSKFFSRGDSDQQAIPVRELPVQEFRELAEATNRMIAERRSAEETLKASEETFRNIVHASPMGIHLYRLEDNIRLVFVGANPAADKLLKVDNSQFIGKTIEEAFPPLRDTEIPLRYRRAAESGESWQTEQVDYTDGKISGAFEVHVFQMSPGNAAVLFNEITRRKQAEEERQHLQMQLLHAQKMESVGRLAGGVAHDFNNMLGVILGHTELALKGMDNAAPLYDSLKAVQYAAERSAALTQQLLAFARKQTVAPKVIDLNETVEGMLNMLRRLIGENIDLLWLPSQSLQSVKIDPAQIDQLLANLCVNARDAIAGEGKITIETASVVFDESYCAEHHRYLPGEYVLLAVSDDGCGMDQGELNHIFEPFFTTKEQGKGTGLGLASALGMVEQNNGFINVYSEPGQGTTFKIYLPAYTEKSAGVVEKAPEQPAERGIGTILLVEDESAILQIATMMLTSLGYTVVAAATPGEAIRLAHANERQIDLLMTDVVMPEMNGRDLARNLMSLYPSIKRLFMSGYTADVIAHHGVLDEGVHFIQKPFSMKDLAAAVREALDE